MKKIAIITQSYKNDYNECKLLCESIDKFASSIDHFIFVNDEDIELFESLNYSNHKIYKKSTVLPWYFFRVPFRIFGHYFYVSPFTIPMREWIMQQICKLSVFDVIDNSYDAVFNIDSETVFMKPFDYNKWVVEDKFMFYKVENVKEPSHDEYCAVCRKFFKSKIDNESLYKYNYMNKPVCFEKRNLQEMLNTIKSKSVFKSWKLDLCNTYRFSEYYTYGIYTDKYLDLRNHFQTNKHYFPQIDISNINSKEEFKHALGEVIHGNNTMGLWLQKKDRKKLDKAYFDFKELEKCIKDYWNSL